MVVSRLPASRRCVRASHTGRRGVATLWMILAFPALLTMLVVVIEIGSLWLAQIEATNALEAASLATAKQWQSTFSTTAAQDRALLLAQSNLVNGQSVFLTYNGGGPAPNNNVSTSGNIVLGALGNNPNTGILTFDPNQLPAGYQFGVMAQATIPVSGVFSQLFGLSAGSYSVSRTTMGSVSITGKDPHLVSGQTFVYGPGTLPAANNLWSVGNVETIIASQAGGTGVWQSQTIPVTVTSDLRGVSFYNARIGWAVGTASGGQSTILLTTDAGTTWTTPTNTVPTASNLNGVTFISNTTGWAVGDGGTILLTVNGGNTWTPANTVPTASNLNGVTFISSTTGWAVGNGGTILLTVDGGNTWTTPTNTVPTASNLNGVTFISNTTGWAVGDGGAILLTVDGGNTWTKTVPTSSNLNGVSFTSSTVGWVVGDSGVILLTVDGGNTWSAPTNGVPTTVNLNGVLFVSSYIGWVVGDSGVVLNTTDGGNSWALQTSNVTQNLHGIAVGP